VAVLSESMAASADRLAAPVIADVRTPALLALIWRGEPNPTLRELLPHCRRCFARPTP
jgi:hypothetical protein